MALAVSGEHQQLAEAVRNWAGRHSPPEAARSVASGAGDAYPAKLAAALAAQGLLGLHLPAAAGGEGYGLPELTVAAEELGRALVPGAFLPTVLASAVLAAAGPGGPGDERGRLLRGLADGTLTGSVALTPGLHVTGSGPAATLTVDGTTGPVLGAPLADLVIAPATQDGREVWLAADATGLAVTAVDGLDLTRPLGQVSAQRLALPPGRLLTGVSSGLVSSLAATLLGAEACGIADWAVSTAAGYAKIRHQFGRPIGQFQAVKHRCAWMLTAAELGAAAVWDAARALAGVAGGTAAAAGSGFAAGVAAVVAVDAAVSCTHECIQVLGGIGYTWEHDAHLYYRRALSLRAVLGGSGDWAQRVAGLAISGGRRPVSIDLPPEAEPLRAQVGQELAAITAGPATDRASRLAAGGWVAPQLPRPWGRGAGPLEQLVIAEQMRAAGLQPPRLAIGAWVVPALAAHGTPEQQQRFLPATLRGEIVWCQLFSEPGAGSDLAGLATRADRAAGGWRLTGQKIWTSLAKTATWGICIARTGPEAPRHDGITYFLVDMTSPGVQVRPLREMTGDALFNEVFLDQVFVPDELVVGGVNQGWQVARTTLANERVSLAESWTFGCGVPELIDTVRGLGERAGQAVTERAGRLVAEGHAIDLLGMRVTRKQLSGTEPGATGSVRKLLGMRLAQRVAQECWSLTGPAGAEGATRWSHAMLFAPALTIGGGTTDIQLNIIGERILGLPRDPVPGG